MLYLIGNIKNPNNKESYVLNRKEWLWCEKCNPWMAHNTSLCNHPEGTCLQMPNYTRNNNNTSRSTGSYLDVAPSHTDNHSRSTQRNSTSHTHAYHVNPRSSGWVQNWSLNQESPRNRTSWAQPVDNNNNDNGWNNIPPGTQTPTPPVASLTQTGWQWFGNTACNNPKSGWGWRNNIPNVAPHHEISKLKIKTMVTLKTITVSMISCDN